MTRVSVPRPPQRWSPESEGHQRQAVEGEVVEECQSLKSLSGQLSSSTSLPFQFPPEERLPEVAQELWWVL